MRKVVQRVRSAVSLVMMGGGEDGIVGGRNEVCLVASSLAALLPSGGNNWVGM